MLVLTEDLVNNIKKWIADLRSGEYQQTTGTMIDPNSLGCCCIGVYSCSVSGKTPAKWVEELTKQASLNAVDNETIEGMICGELQCSIPLVLSSSHHDPINIGPFGPSKDGDFGRVLSSVAEDYRDGLLEAKDLPDNPNWTSFSCLNDNGVPFEKIADYIEYQLDKITNSKEK